MIYSISGIRIQGSTEYNFGLCSLSLFINYFFFAALNLWCMILSYVWYSSFQEARKKSFDRRKRKYNRNIGWIHVSTWLTSFILTMVAWQGGRDYNAIEGDSLIGICFISNRATTWFIFLVCLPIFVTLAVLLSSCGVSCKTLSGYLTTAKSQGLKSNHIRAIKFHRLRIALFIVPLVICIVIQLGLSVYDMYHKKPIDASFKRFLITKIKDSVSEEGYYQTANMSRSSESLVTLNRQRPSFVLARVLIQPLCFLIISTLVCTRASLFTWKRLVIKLYEILTNRKRKNENDFEMHHPNNDVKGEEEKNNEEVPKVKKLQLMAQAWSKRFDVAETGKLSITLSDDDCEYDETKMKHAQPVVIGVLESLNQSNGEEEASGFHSITEFNDFAAALPRLVQRRNGCAGAIELGLKRWGSVDSNLHLSRAVSIRSSRTGGYSFNSRRSSFVGSRLGNGESQQSAYQSEFSDYLYSIHRDPLRASKKSLKAMRFVKRFSRRSMKSTDLSSKDVSAQNSVESEDNDVTILPAITIHQESQKPACGNVHENADMEAVNAKLTQIKSRLQEKQLKVPGPGNSINILPLGLQKFEQATNNFSKIDNKNVISSKETYLSEEDTCQLVKSNVPSEPTRSSFEQVAIQTSLTDLSALGKYL